MQFCLEIQKWLFFSLVKIQTDGFLPRVNFLWDRPFESPLESFLIVVVVVSFVSFYGGGTDTEARGRGLASDKWFVFVEDSKEQQLSKTAPLNALLAICCRQ